MKKVFNYSCALLSTLVALPHVARAEFAVPVIKPFDLYLWSGPCEPHTWQLGGYYAGSFHETGSTASHEKVNVLQMWQCTQNALTMTWGFDPESKIGQLAARLHDANDDGRRGHMIPSAHLSMQEGGISARYWVNYGVCFGAYLPLYHMKLCNVSWQDLTNNVTVGDRMTKELVTDDIAATVAELDPCYNISSGWSRRGPGDLSLLARWQKDFPQSKQLLTNVQLSVYSGVMLPTGLRADENKLFPIPFGNDGSTAIPFGGAIQVQWRNHWVGGVELNFEQIFSHTRCRRVKTDQNQTDLLLLQKVNASIDWGFYQRYRLYAGGYNLIRGFSFDIGYQYTHQDNSYLNLCSNQLLECNANSAASLKAWTLHQIMVHAYYDCHYDATPTSKVVPHLGFFYHHVFKGQRAVRLDKVGLSLDLSF